jgi:hypothetical protein
MSVEWRREGRFVYFTLHGPKLATLNTTLPRAGEDKWVARQSDEGDAMAKTPPAPTTPPWETSFTCDWGDCDDETVAWRYSGQRLTESPLGWLPVCAKHARSGVVEVRRFDGSVDG